MTEIGLFATLSILLKAQKIKNQERYKAWNRKEQILLNRDFEPKIFGAIIMKKKS